MKAEEIVLVFLGGIGCAGAPRSCPPCSVVASAPEVEAHHEVPDEQLPPSVNPKQSAPPILSASSAKLPIPPFLLDDWPHWVDENGDCQDTRAEVLIRRSHGPVLFTTSAECEVAHGIWYDAYTGQQETDAQRLVIDHLVSPAEAHIQGGYKWEDWERLRFANSDRNLLIVSKEGKELRGGRGADEWLPLTKVCQYIEDRGGVRGEWRLRRLGSEGMQYVDLCLKKTP